MERTGYARNTFLAGRGPQLGAHESVTIRANRSRSLDLYTGVSSIGQGTETVFAQLAAVFFGTDLDAVTVHGGDTGASPLNTGSFASRTVIAGTGTVIEAREHVKAKTLRIAAHALELDDANELEFVGREMVLRHDPGRGQRGDRRTSQPERWPQVSAPTAPEHFGASR